MRAGQPLLAPLQAPRPQACLKVPGGQSPGAQRRREEGTVISRNPHGECLCCWLCREGTGQAGGHQAASCTLGHCLRWDSDGTWDSTSGASAPFSSRSVVSWAGCTHNGGVFSSPETSGWCHQPGSIHPREVAVPAANARSPVWGQIPLGPQQLQTGVRQQLPWDCVSTTVNGGKF